MDAVLQSIGWAHAIPRVTGYEGCNQECGRERLDADADGRAVVSGGLNEPWSFPTTSSELTFEPSDSVSGFVMSFDVSGRLEGGFQLGGGGQLAFNDVAFCAEQRICLVGHFAHGVDFDPGPERVSLQYSLTMLNSFVMRSDPTGSAAITTSRERSPATIPGSSAWQVFPNPTRGPLRLRFDDPPSSETMYGVAGSKRSIGDPRLARSTDPRLARSRSSCPTISPSGRTSWSSPMGAVTRRRASPSCSSVCSRGRSR